MKIRRLLLLSAVFLLILTACQDDENLRLIQLDQDLTRLLNRESNGQGLNFFRLPESDDLAEIPEDPRNPLTPEKVELGRLLYHETGLGIAPMQELGEASYSCASCHFASAGFQANRHQGIGEGGTGFGINGEGRIANPDYEEENLDVQPIRSPAALNVAYQEVMLWNGQFGATGPNAGTEYAWSEETPKEVNHLGYQGVESQAIAGLEVHRLAIDTAFLRTTGYKELFDAVFPNFVESERYTRETAGLAIAAYERTLLANQAPFQQWLRGQSDAMTAQEKRGALLFFGKAECGSCHTGPALNTMDFYAYGMGDLWDCPEPSFEAPSDHPVRFGRGGFTERPADQYKFKVPQLYNLSDSPFYGHGATFRSIREVVEYKNEAVPENEEVPEQQLAEEFAPLDLTDEEVADITAFLERALHDPNLERYEPEALLSGNCFPFNDPVAREELGCE